MKIIRGRNVNEVLLLGLQELEGDGVTRDSRNGPVQVFKEPVTSIYEKPNERVLFFKERDANPYFHFMEGLWMIAGRNDVDWISQFSSNIANYSDDGITFHGGYGKRWRSWFGREEMVIDQLATIANLLKQNPDDRRVVLQMWDPDADLGMSGKDFPCNLIATFRINPYGSLDMTVFNRSNDMIWGAYGANAVHFSMMQEVMASWIGVPIGIYWQISTNFHAYHSTLNKHKDVRVNCPGHDKYALGDVVPYPMVNTSIEEWMTDLQMFMEAGAPIGLHDPFFKKVAVPMLQSWLFWKDKNMSKAIQFAENIIAEDWRVACVEWLQRRQ